MSRGYLFDTVACSRWRRGDMALRSKMETLRVDAILNIKGPLLVEELRKHGKIVFLSPWVDIVGIEARQVEIGKNKKLVGEDWIRESAQNNPEGLSYISIDRLYISTLWRRNFEILANLPGKDVHNFHMPWDCRCLSIHWIVIDRMAPTIPKKFATVLFQVAN